MLGPSILFASAPVALTESIGAVRKPGERMLGVFSLLVAVPALALVLSALVSFFLLVLTK